MSNYLMSFYSHLTSTKQDVGYNSVLRRQTANFQGFPSVACFSIVHLVISLFYKNVTSLVPWWRLRDSTSLLNVCGITEATFCFVFLFEECLHLNSFDYALLGVWQNFFFFLTLIAGDKRSSTFISRLFIITTLENVFNWASFGRLAPFFLWRE